MSPDQITTPAKQTPAEPFQEWPKIPRFSREVVVTEKIDGTNALVYVADDGQVFAGSRTRWIHPKDDNYGFARWVEGHREELVKLGPGRHFGEWWGAGIQRGYGMKEKHFSLFNTWRWAQLGRDTLAHDKQEFAPACCSVVPILYQGPFNLLDVDNLMSVFGRMGSQAALGFMKPEGIVIFHTAGNCYFKKTFEKDESPKSKV